MGFTYSGNPSTSVRDEVRFLIQDTDEARPLLADEELDYIISKWWQLYTNATYCAAIAAGTVARKWAKVVNVSAGGTSAALGDLQARYTAMSDQLMKEYREEGDVGGLVNLENILAGTQYDPTIEPLEFAMGLHDNPEAGAQNYGGRYGSGTYADEPRGYLL